MLSIYKLYNIGVSGSEEAAIYYQNKQAVIFGRDYQLKAALAATY